MNRRLALLLGLAALVLPATAVGGNSFVVVDDAAVVPSPDVPNAAGEIAVATDFTAAPTWVEQLSVDQLMPIWQRAGATYGVPWELLAAINNIETNFGQNMGPSSAGAVGWMQFMPDTWMRWGMDADGNGLADPWDAEDAIFAAARYLAAAGAQTDIPRAVFAYNHASWYVDEVLALASVYAGGGSIAVPGFAGLPVVDLESAQLTVAQAGDALTRAVNRERQLARLEAVAELAFDDADLLSDSLLAQKRLTIVGVSRDAAAAEVARLRNRLADAEASLQAARAGVLATPFALRAGTFGLVPTNSGFAFPVGGGAGQVSVAATHHDYPAADIVAPAGSPIYAHEDGVVVRGWSTPEGRCGIGFTMRAADGRSWTYCHLSYLEPSVTTGALVPVGTPVGLVGTTGHSSGPHLHLQLAPPTSYPQEETWFSEFAGSAFSWNGSAPARRAPVFTVVPEPAPRVESVVLFTKSS